MTMEMPDQGLETISEPSWLRQHAGRLALATITALGLGGGVAAAAGGDNAATTVTGHAIAPIREALSVAPEPSVDNETRMRHKQEADKIHSLQTMYAFILWTSAATPRIPYDSTFWDSLHDCEQPNIWHAGGHFGNGLRSGGNGLGMSVDAWRMGVSAAAERGVILPATGWGADINEQKEAAQAFLDKHGWGWGCPRP